MQYRLRYTVRKVFQMADLRNHQVRINPEGFIK